MNLLPFWHMTIKKPAFYDAESGSAIEQTAKVYGAMNELIGEYNKFAENTNKIISEFTAKTKEEQNIFENCIKEMMHTYIESIDIMIQKQDLKIADAEKYMKENITETAITLINNALADGTIVLGLNYDDSTESLDIGGIANEE